MTQEEKQILLKDLCARLPYGVKMKYKNEEGASTLCQIDTLYTDVDGFHCLIRMAEPPGIFYDLTEFKPYLRPMSSMTEEEIDRMWEIYESGPAAESSVAVAEYLYGNHLDCHYLIEKGLALEAPKGMYGNV